MTNKFRNIVTSQCHTRVLPYSPVNDIHMSYHSHQSMLHISQVDHMINVHTATKPTLHVIWDIYTVNQLNTSTKRSLLLLLWSGPVFTNIVSDSDFTYRLRLRFLTLQSRLCEKFKVVFTNVPKARLYRVYKLLLM